MEAAMIRRQRQIHETSGTGGLGHLLIDDVKPAQVR
jgi:hypothetical protein